MGTAIALASVVSSAAVALGVVFLSSRFETRRAQWQVAVSRLDELRGVLDDAASHADQALFEANGVWSLLDQERTEPDPQGVLAEFERHLNLAGAAKLKIALRIGEASELFQRYEDILTPLWQVWDLEVKAVHGSAPFDAEAAEELLNQATAANGLFLNRASQLVGPDVTLVGRPAA